MRRGPTTYLRLSHGRLEAGRAAARFLLPGDIPVVGTTRELAVHNMRRREPAAWAAESDGKRNFRAADAPPLFVRTKPPVWPLQSLDCSAEDRIRTALRGRHSSSPGPRRLVSR